MEAIEGGEPHNDFNNLFYPIRLLRKSRPFLKGQRVLLNGVVTLLFLNIMRKTSHGVVGHDSYHARLHRKRLNTLKGSILFQAKLVFQKYSQAETFLVQQQLFGRLGSCCG